MLTIRAEQYAELERAHRRSLEREAMAFLRDQFPDAAAEPEGALLPAVGEQIRQAIGYGLETKRQIFVYLVAAWTLGRYFDRRSPEAAGILGSTELTADSKRRWLSHWVPGVVERRGKARSTNDLG